MFDETVRENQDVFDLSEEEAVAETVDQLVRQGVDPRKSGIVLAHPDCDETHERKRRAEFREQVEWLDRRVVREDGTLADDDDDVGGLALERSTAVRSALAAAADDGTIDAYASALSRSEGTFTLLSLLSSENERLVETAADCLSTLLSSSRGASADAKREIRTVSTPAAPRIAERLRKIVESDDEKRNDDLLRALLRLATCAATKCQDNKAGLVRAGKIFPVLLRLLSSEPPTTNDEGTKNHRQLMMMTCQLLSTLCRYDDFSANSSTAHEFALDLYRRDAVPTLHRLLSRYPLGCTGNDDDDNVEVQTAVMTAQRVLAVDDDVVQALAARGALDDVARALDDDRLPPLTAAVALVRNLCGNDDVKTTACRGAVAPSLLRALSVRVADPSLCEHAVASLAAMCLRRPRNAERLCDDANAVPVVLAAARRHPSHARLQRQFALFARNAVARRDAEARARIREEHAPELETALRDAGAIAGCVDEAYAALRDLGVDGVGVVRVTEEEDDEGNVKRTVRRGVEMFGGNTTATETAERSGARLNFRPTFDESADVEKRIDGLF